MIDAPCVIEDCDSPAHIRGWCNRHYIRWQRHGDPLAGRRANGTGSPDKKGYVHLHASGERGLAHRMAMAAHLGRPLSPHEEVHHINEDPSDNRIENLRLVTHEEHLALHGRKVRN